MISMMRGSRVVAGREPSRDEAGQSVPLGLAVPSAPLQVVPMVVIGGGSPLSR